MYEIHSYGERAAENMKIGIYGGTFNPVHYGHLRTAEEVAERLSLDKILFIPAGKTPFDKPDLEKAGHRYKMVKAAINGNPHFNISGLEIKASGKSYTVDTLIKLRNKYRKSEFYFILGIDAFIDLPCWKHPGRLVELTNLVVISRPDYSFAELLSSPYLKGVSRKILRELDKRNREEVIIDIAGNSKGILINVTGINISASHIRDLMKSGKNINYLLPDSVKSYIISHNLYINMK